MKVREIKTQLEAMKVRSAWSKGVKVYALELIEELTEGIEGGYIDPETINSRTALKEALLNGAQDWNQYSWGGCSLIYDYDIAERLCNPTELKRTNHGEKEPNKSEAWLDVQARALYQAYRKIANLVF